MKNLNTVNHWSFYLKNSNLYEKYGLTLIKEDLPIGVTIKECDFENDTIFEFSRFFDGSRYTNIDLFGVIGLASFNFYNNTTILTEGVSDFLTARLIFSKNVNVLGKTSSSPKHLISFLTNSKNVFICCDNDKTGLNIGAEYKKYITFAEVYLYVPFSGKDISDECFSCGSSRLLEHFKKFINNKN